MNSDQDRPDLSAIKHDLSSPLTTIQMTLHLLLDGSLGELSDQQSTFLGKAKDECDRVIGLVNHHFSVDQKS
ncbi:hypothetical protein N9891_00310 [bacterium]|nr:hypothetical protein [bacterium]